MDRAWEEEEKSYASGEGLLVDGALEVIDQNIDSPGAGAQEVQEAQAVQAAERVYPGYIIAEKYLSLI